MIKGSGIREGINWAELQGFSFLRTACELCSSQASDANLLIGGEINERTI